MGWWLFILTWSVPLAMSMFLRLSFDYPQHGILQERAPTAWNKMQNAAFLWPLLGKFVFWSTGSHFHVIASLNALKRKRGCPRGEKIHAKVKAAKREFRNVLFSSQKRKVTGYQLSQRLGRRHCSVRKEISLKSCWKPKSWKREFIVVSCSSCRKLETQRDSFSSGSKISKTWSKHIHVKKRVRFGQTQWEHALGGLSRGVCTCVCVCVCVCVSMCLLSDHIVLIHLHVLLDHSFAASCPQNCTNPDNPWLRRPGPVTCPGIAPRPSIRRGEICECLSGREVGLLGTALM